MTLKGPGSVRKALDVGQEDSNVEELAASIREKGLLSPLTVRPLADGRFEILVGQRRYLACKLVLLDPVPCLIREGLSDAEAIMVATAFDPDAPFDQRRAIIWRDGDGVEMVELPWGLRPREPGGPSFTVIRAEGRTFPTHRCLVPASEFRYKSRGRRYSFTLADGDWFYFAGIWRPATRDWPEAYSILTTEANADVAPYHDRQMAVLKRNQRLDWLDAICPENELLQPLPSGSFRVKQDRGVEAMQSSLAF